MKAIIKATGEIIEVSRIMDKYIMRYHPCSITFDKEELEFDDDCEPSYWNKLKHQAAISAMQGLLMNPKLCDIETANSIASTATTIASALIDKLKEE